MKRILLLAAAILGLFFFVGCSKDTSTSDWMHNGVWTADVSAQNDFTSGTMKIKFINGGYEFNAELVDKDGTGTHMSAKQYVEISYNFPSITIPYPRGNDGNDKVLWQGTISDDLKEIRFGTMELPFSGIVLRNIVFKR